MKGRYLFQKTRGQSAIFIALLIVVLIAMVGLAVDVGNTYAQQRSVVRATNAAAVAAMDKVINGGTDADVSQAITGSLTSNGIKVAADSANPASDERTVVAHYLDSAGNTIGAGCVVGTGACGTNPPQGTAYIQIEVDGSVDTYFAKLVGTQSLPVDAQSFAAQCLPTKNVFPIAVPTSLLASDGSGFVEPSVQSEKAYYGIYRDSEYRTGRYQRRVYYSAIDGVPKTDSFGWVAWKSGSSASDLATSLTLDGNIYKGFAQLGTWPSSSSLVEPTTNGVSAYPINSTGLDAGDWIYGGTAGSSWSSSLKSQLQFHVDHRTKLNLPIVRERVKDNGQVVSYVDRLGTFYLRGYSSDSSSLSLDLVYLGDTKTEACLTTNLEEVPGYDDPPGVPNSLGIKGTVNLYPRWAEEVEPTQPVAYTIILDVSGSMSYNFNGEGTISGTNYNCENPDNPSAYAYNSTCQGGPYGYWKTESERRIYIAKNAIKDFIDRMGTTDVMKIVSFSNSISSNTSVTPSGSTWLSDKTTLKTAVDQAGRYNSNTYLTQGGTPGAHGVAKAADLLGSAPTKDVNGKEYKLVAIYLTDGVANVFYPNGGGPATDLCAPPDYSARTAQNIARCQIGYMANGTARPITAMIEQADRLRTLSPSAAVYSIAMGPVDETGLDRVASGSSYAFTARQAGVVDDIFNQIYRQVNGDCVAQTSKPIDRIDDDHSPDLTLYPELSSDTYGYVYLYDSNGIALPVGQDKLAIKHDATSGKLSFSLSPDAGLKPGTYQLKAYVAYKGDDEKTRTYKSIIDQGTLTASASWTFTVSPSDTLGTIVELDPLYLDLEPSVQVCEY